MAVFFYRMFWNLSTTGNFQLCVLLIIFAGVVLVSFMSCKTPLCVSCSWPGKPYVSSTFSFLFLIVWVIYNLWVLVFFGYYLINDLLFVVCSYLVILPITFCKKLLLNPNTGIHIINFMLNPMLSSMLFRYYTLCR